MSDDELVTVAVAESEGEAAMICGYLDSQGIDATYDKSGIAQPFAITGLGAAHVGPQEILVRASDAEAARAALDARPD